MERRIKVLLVMTLYDMVWLNGRITNEANWKWILMMTSFYLSRLLDTVKIFLSQWYIIYSSHFNSFCAVYIFIHSLAYMSRSQAERRLESLPLSSKDTLSPSNFSPSNRNYRA